MREYGILFFIAWFAKIHALGDRLQYGGGLGMVCRWIQVDDFSCW